MDDLFQRKMNPGRKSTTKMIQDSNDEEDEAEYTLMGGIRGAGLPKIN